MVLLAVQREDGEVAITTDELDAGDVVGCALEVNGLLRAVCDIVDVYGDLRVRRTGLRVLIGIGARVLPRAVDRHAVLVDLTLIGADEGQVVIVFAPGHQLRGLQLFFVDPVGDTVHDLVVHGIARHLDLGVELKLLDEDIPLTHEGYHTAVGAEGGDHNLAGGRAQWLDAVATHVVVEDITLARAAVDGFLVGDEEDVMPLGLKDVVVEFLEFAFACLVDAEECVDEFARLEAIAQDGGVSVVHHRVVLPVAGGAHTAPCGVGVELTRGDVLDLEVLGGVLGQSLGACT